MTNASIVANKVARRATKTEARLAKAEAQKYGVHH